MNRYTYRAFYDDTPTVSDPLRAAKNDDEIRVLLDSLPSRLTDHCRGARIDAGEIVVCEVQGVPRLSRQVLLTTDANEKVAKDLIARAFIDLDLSANRSDKPSGKREKVSQMEPDESRQGTEQSYFDEVRRRVAAQTPDIAVVLKAVRAAYNLASEAKTLGNPFEDVSGN
ncbi:hypothetical protein K6V72_18865 [Ralstonia insidiosa]|jgi:hypothetical protein|uniref:Uncharacterized protein n=2 Tax=Ralstonia insidiosa TaxID=190721 RepID=A0A192A3I1_9RALS|nr:MULTISPECIES: hypothetical protein [Ralstonia]ANJ74903.1 hypothetical protein A9Y76_20355 [Ralstonia insidiosa]KAB0468376.1 hypothetical protein F7R11_24425 [Ralstonia insidiosa]MBY4911082.1 hypothetical protein [Ralstonia insidiosa]